MGNQTWTGRMRGARERLSVSRGNSQQAFCHNIGNECLLNFQKYFSLIAIVLKGIVPLKHYLIYSPHVVPNLDH